ncbi:cytochrome P450 [Xylaria arbuscula]|nr:cytochrome P450 [Xylaria arbuscula]
MLDSESTFTTYVVLVTVVLASYAVRCAALPKPVDGIPYHKSSATRVLGDAPAMIQHARRHGTVFDWMVQQAVILNSPIFQLFLKPFSKPAIFITDPREAQDILLRRTKDFDRSRFFKDVFGGTVPYCHVVQPTNDKFRQGRRLLADTMAAPFLNRVAAPLLHKHTLNLIELWQVKTNATAGHAFSVADDLSYFALDSIWNVAFGSQLNSLPEEVSFLKGISKFDIPMSRHDPIQLPKLEANRAANSMRILTHGLDAAVTSPTPSLSHWLLSLTPSYRRAKSYKERLVQESLDDAKARLLSHMTHEDELEGITCATDHMVRRESQAADRENRAPNYGSREAKDELFGFLVGGYDTTATTLMWSVKLIADNPYVQDKLRTVLLNTFGGEGGIRRAIPTPEKITAIRIPYLDAVIEEVVRCAQTASSATRVTLHETELLGYRVPKGVDVYMLSNGPGYMLSNDLNETIPEHVRSTSSQESKHRVPPNWASGDISVFRPERWIKTDERGIEIFDMHAGPSMQFGAGLRGCFGKKLAYLEIRILIVLLLWTFELQAVPEDLRGYEAFDSLTHKPRKCYVKLKGLREL